MQAESYDDDLNTVASSGESLVPTDQFIERSGFSFDFESSHGHESDFWMIGQHCCLLSVVSGGPLFRGQ